MAERLVAFAAEGIEHIQALLYPTTPESIELFARAATLARSS